MEVELIIENNRVLNHAKKRERVFKRDLKLMFHNEYLAIHIRKGIFVSIFQNIL